MRGWLGRVMENAEDAVRDRIRDQRFRDDQSVEQAVREGYNSGFAIMRATGLRPHRYIPALDRLQSAGRVEDYLEDLVDADRPPRRLYRVVE